MNAATSILSKFLIAVVAGTAAFGGVAAISSPAQATVVSHSKAKPTQVKEVVREIKRHYGPDNSLANRFHTLWQVTLIVDERTGAVQRVKATNNVYCQAFPSTLGWSGKASCTLKKIATGWLITNEAVFKSPQICIGTLCTPAQTMTLGSRIYLDRVGSISREEPIGNSA